MSQCRYSDNRRDANGPEDFGGRVLSGRGRAHGIMLRGRHCVWHLLRYFSKELLVIWASWNAVPVEFNLDHAFDISDASLQEILSHTRTEQQLTSFFEKRLQTYLEQKDIEFVIAGNGSTVMPWGEQSSNSHEETDSLIAHIIKLAVEQVLCTVIPLYTIISNLFFKIIKKMVQFHRSNLFS